MATKTISLEIDAYERLKAAKRRSRESFSEVVRRAVWPDSPITAGRLLEIWSSILDGEALDLEAIEDADRDDKEPADPWN